MKFVPFWDDVLMFNVIGGRGTGKTDYFMKLAIMLYDCYGCQTTWVRHKLNELTDEGNYKDFLNDAKEFGWCPDEWEARADGVYTSSEQTADKVILYASISTFSNKRGSGHPRVLMVVFDEMLPEDGKYKPNAKMCVKGLMSIMESMTRGRDGSVLFVASNYVNAGNPYWAKLEIYNNPRYDVTVYRDKAVAIEVASGYKVARKEDSKLSKLMRAAKMPLYMDERTDPLITLVSPIPNGAKPMPYIITTDGQYYREYTHKGASYWMRWKGNIPNGTMVLTNSIAECGEGVEMLPPIFYRRVKADIDSNMVRFKDANVMFKILNMIYDSIA